MQIWELMTKIVSEYLINGKFLKKYQLLMRKIYLFYKFLQLTIAPLGNEDEGVKNVPLPSKMWFSYVYVVLCCIS